MRDIFASRNIVKCALAFGGIATLSMAAYGAIMGSFAGVQQALYSSLKLPMVLVGSGLICLPSFYVFQCLLGARLTFFQAVSSVLLLSAAAGMIMVGCAPIAWFFTISTEAEAWRFIAFLHVAVIGLSILFGMHLLSRAHRYFKWKNDSQRFFDGRILVAWNMLFALVVMQMAHYVGPLMFGDAVFVSGERGMFTSSIEYYFGIQGE